MGLKRQDNDVERRVSYRQTCEKENTLKINSSPIPCTIEVH